MKLPTYRHAPVLDEECGQVQDMKLRRICTFATLMASYIGAAMAQAPQTSQAPTQSSPPREELAVYAAGSLRVAMTDLARAFERAAPAAVKLTLGPSGLLRDRIQSGEPAQVFASANMNHPQALRDSGRAESVRPFARNALCALASGAFDLRGKTLAQRMLDPDVRVGTSTPVADPSGDYAFQMFDRVESTGAAVAGSAAALKSKALQLTGGTSSPQPPPGRNLYGMLVDEGKADVFITYCTNANEARQQLPALKILPVPDALNVSAVYGIATLAPAAAAAKAFVEFVLGPQGQGILQSHGFSAP